MAKVSDGEPVCFCETCQEIKTRILTELPLPRRQQCARSNVDDLLGGCNEAPDGDSNDASSVSEDDGDSEDEAPPKIRKVETPLAPTQGQGENSMGKVRPARQGLASQAWLSLFNTTTPSTVIIAAPITFQAGLLVAIMQYNDSQFGLGACQLVACCVEPPPAQTESEWARKYVKVWQAVHMCLHAIDGALHGYSAGRHNAMMSNHGLCLAAGPMAKRRRRLRQQDTGGTEGTGQGEETSTSPSEDQ